MAESQGDTYIRRDVFEARMDRMEMLLEKTVLEIKSYVDKSTGETRTYVEKAIGGLRDEVKSDIGNLKNEVKSDVANLRDEVKSDIANFKNEVKSDIANFKDEVKSDIGGLRAEIVELKNDVNVLTARVDSMENVLYWGLGLFGIILALGALLPSIFEATRKFFTPSNLNEEMEKIAERVANAVIERHLSGGK